MWIFNSYSLQRKTIRKGRPSPKESMYLRLLHVSKSPLLLLVALRFIPSNFVNSQLVASFRVHGVSNAFVSLWIVSFYTRSQQAWNITGAHVLNFIFFSAKKLKINRELEWSLNTSDVSRQPMRNITKKRQKRDLQLTRDFPFGKAVNFFSHCMRYNKIISR